MPREPIPTWFFSLVLVHRDDQILLVQEAKHGQGWYLPAGRAEPGETLAQAAHRETWEEAGIPVVLEGVLRVEHTPTTMGARLRTFFVARPADDRPPKSTPDRDSLRADWFDFRQIPSLNLRSPEVVALAVELSGGAPVVPLHAFGLAHQTRWDWSEPPWLR